MWILVLCHLWRIFLFGRSEEDVFFQNPRLYIISLWDLYWKHCTWSLGGMVWELVSCMTSVMRARFLLSVWWLVVEQNWSGLWYLVLHNDYISLLPSFCIMYLKSMHFLGSLI